MLLTQRLHQRAKTCGDEIIYRFWSASGKEETLSYQQLSQQVDILSDYLQSHYEPQSRLLLMYQNNAAFIIAFYACLQADLIAVPIRQLRPQRSLMPLILIKNNANPAAILIDSPLWNRFQQHIKKYDALQDINFVVTDLLTTDLSTKTHLNTCVRRVVNPEHIAFLQYTSGSTGQPKGVMVTQANVLHNLGMMQRGAHHTRQTIGCNWLPHYHDMGLIGGILQPLFVGLPVTLLAPLAFLQRPIRWLEIISQQGITSTGGPNFAYQLCVDRIKDEQLAELDLSAWEVAFVGAEPIHYATLKAFADKFAPCGFRWEAFYPCYGLAEATLIVSGGTYNKALNTLCVDRDALQRNHIQLADKQTSDLRKYTLVSCGDRASLGQKIHIIDPDTEQLCEEGRVGEIITHSGSVSQGYWQRPEEMPTLSIYNNKQACHERFLRTGDLGFLYQDELYVTGRCKELIIIDGQNHYPHDIESSIANCHPAIYAQAAFAWTQKNHETLGLIIEIHRRWQHKVTALNEVIRQIRQYVAVQHELTVGVIVLVKQGTIPLTSSGKIKRLQCQQRYLAQDFQTLAKWSHYEE